MWRRDEFRSPRRAYDCSLSNLPIPAESAAVLALYGNAKPISLWDGIRREDVVDVKIDILLIDQDFRNSKTWSNQRDFFEQFERHPESWGFRKAKVVLPNGLKIYFRPNHDAFSYNPSPDQNPFFRRGLGCAVFDVCERTPPMRSLRHNAASRRERI